MCLEMHLRELERNSSAVDWLKCTSKLSQTDLIKLQDLLNPEMRKHKKLSLLRVHYQTGLMDVDLNYISIQAAELGIILIDDFIITLSWNKNSILIFNIKYSSFCSAVYVALLHRKINNVLTLEIVSVFWR